ncbi:hypothetical protein BMW23_0927 [Bodo saltans virus]|uniref:Transmembrane protein n=1 Tax=Bodo saltans virus TaxID=2024608 RepID=A0A2H4UVM4_9VIRU|nr:hypothetical protein QJ851_gp0909 [Bodo saltans virus]ATZ80972.1 hypothetical protein BMW23_0927 [Bodo saltans virus]
MNEQNENQTNINEQNDNQTNINEQNDNQTNTNDQNENQTNTNEQNKNKIYTNKNKKSKIIAAMLNCITIYALYLSFKYNRGIRISSFCAAYFAPVIYIAYSFAVH